MAGRHTVRAASFPAHGRRFQRRLLDWYRTHGRRLPWRKTRDPYKVLVSEIMLQQTQVDRVIPKYREFLARYPTVKALSQAPVKEVRRAWYPLGYNIRPVRLHGIAKETVARYGGRLPEDAEALLAFDGIGPYTAGAVRAFAFGQDAAIVDTNVRRVLARVFLGPRSRPRPARLWRLSAALLPAGQAYDFNQALMDLGALVCTAKAPRCPACPMRAFCKARKAYASSG